MAASRWLARSRRPSPTITTWCCSARKPIDVDAMKARLGVDLSGCGYQCVVDDDTASTASADFDLFINTTYRSSTVNLAPLGSVLRALPRPACHGPQRASRADRARRREVCRSGQRWKAPRQCTRGSNDAPSAQNWVRSYTTFLANSTFTAGWVARLWNVPSDVLYPPVRPEVRARQQVAHDRRGRPILRPEVRALQEAARFVARVPSS